MSRLAHARARLQASYRVRLHDRIAELAQAMAALSAGDGGAGEEILALAHKLRGSGASFGLPRISEAAEAVECAGAEALPAATLALIAVLRDHAAEPRNHT